MLCNSPKYTLAYTHTHTHQRHTQARHTSLLAGLLAILAEMGFNFCWQPEETNWPITTYKNASYMFSQPVVMRQSQAEGSSISISVGVKFGLNYACSLDSFVWGIVAWGASPRAQAMTDWPPFSTLSSKKNQAWQQWSSNLQRKGRDGGTRSLAHVARNNGGRAAARGVKAAGMISDVAYVFLQLSAQMRFGLLSPR